MTTVVNNPPAQQESNGMGFLIGIILVILAIFIFIAYGIPALRQSLSVPQINVPDKVDVNINNPNK